VEILTLNPYIGGATLEMHSKNLCDPSPLYRYDLNGSFAGERMISLEDAINEAEWDAVVFQQSSDLSGFIDSFHPWLDGLSAWAKKFAPNAGQYIFRTWAYDGDGRISLFENSQTVMHGALGETAQLAADSIGAKVIPCGEVIQTLRKTEPYFDTKTGALLTRDGSHMSIPYGCYAIGAVWYETLIGGIEKTVFVPENADAEVIGRIKRQAKATVNTIF
nr:DUF4886 domain-containing protein [Clostridia bacterium]